MTDAQFTAMMGMLKEIRDLLRGPETPEGPGAECPHPEEKRVDLSTPRDPDHWVCSLCRFEHNGVCVT